MMYRDDDGDIFLAFTHFLAFLAHGQEKNRVKKRPDGTKQIPLRMKI